MIILNYRHYNHKSNHLWFIENVTPTRTSTPVFLFLYLYQYMVTFVEFHFTDYFTFLLFRQL